MRKDPKPKKRLAVNAEKTKKVLKDENAKKKLVRLNEGDPAKRLFDTLESISEGFFILDRQWRFIYVNREAIHLWKRSEEELIGRSIWDIVPKAVGTVFEKLYHKAVDEQVPVAFEAPSPLLGGA